MHRRRWNPPLTALRNGKLMTPTTLVGVRLSYLAQCGLDTAQQVSSKRVFTHEEEGELLAIESCL